MIKDRMQRAKNHVPLIQGWPADLVCIINGRRIYKADVLAAKRERQARRLAWIRQRTEPRRVPCFVWVFDNGPVFPYGGTWLYIRTAKRSYRIEGRPDRLHQMALKIMALFPCGLEPVIENVREWRDAFILEHSRPTKKRPSGNGLALATAIIDPGGNLLDVVERQ